MELVGRTLGQYRVIEELGRGGMGIVYRAEDLRLGRQVALKVLQPEVSLNEDRIERFRREARSLASLNHPGIVTLYGVEEIDGHILLAMELVEGKTLDELIPAGGLAVERFFRLAVSLVDAVSAAHQQSIVHRDLKPGNVMLTAEGRIKVLDFGLAKLRAGPAAADASQAATEALTAVGAMIGTAPYMAPEQIRGAAADERSDIFSLGVVLFQMATGRHPFRTESQADVLSSILRDDPPSLITLKPLLPRHLDRILRCALDKDPERRYQSAKELRNQLERLAEEVTKATATKGTIPMASLPARKVRWRSAAGVAAMLLAASGFGLWSFKSRHQPAAPLVLPHLAVMELRRFSGEVGPEPYRSGLVAAFAERLSGLQGVWVLPRGAADPLPDLLVEADVRKLANAVTLQLRVQERQGRRILGSDLLEGSAREPYDLLDRAGASVAKWLQVEAKLPVRYEAGPVPTQDPAAFAAFLRAEEEMAGGREPPDLRAALALVRQALAEDPGFAPAQALAGEIHLRRFRETRLPKSLDDAAEACRQAAELDPELAAAHLCLGGVHRARQHPLEAQEEYVRAIELRPTSLDAYDELRELFQDMGLPEAAERTWKQIIARHPGYWAGHEYLAVFYYDSDRWAAAIDGYRRALDLAPNNSKVQRELGSACHLLGRYEDGDHRLSKVSRHPSQVVGLLQLGGGLPAPAALSGGGGIRRAGPFSSRRRPTGPSGDSAGPTSGLPVIGIRRPLRSNRRSRGAASNCGGSRMTRAPGSGWPTTWPCWSGGRRASKPSKRLCSGARTTLTTSISRRWSTTAWGIERRRCPGSNKRWQGGSAGRRCGPAWSSTPCGASPAFRRSLAGG